MMQSMYDNIPQEMKDRKQWVGASEKKEPMGLNSYRAKTNDSSTWHTFEAVVDGKERGLFPAIGYIFSKDDPYTGIDFDDVRNPETGEILPWVAKLS